MTVVGERGREREINSLRESKKRSECVCVYMFERVCERENCEKYVNV